MFRFKLKMSLKFKLHVTSNSKAKSQLTVQIISKCAPELILKLRQKHAHIPETTLNVKTQPNNKMQASQKLNLTHSFKQKAKT